MPALYVGTNGLLYAEISTGTVAPIQSNVAVNVGREHTAVLTVPRLRLPGLSRRSRSTASMSAS